MSELERSPNGEMMPWQYREQQMRTELRLAVAKGAISAEVELVRHRGTESVDAVFDMADRTAERATGFVKDRIAKVPPNTDIEMLLQHILVAASRKAANIADQAFPEEER